MLLAKKDPVRRLLKSIDVEVTPTYVLYADEVQAIALEEAGIEDPLQAIDWCMNILDQLTAGKPRGFRLQKRRVSDGRVDK